MLLVRRARRWGMIQKIRIEVEYHIWEKSYLYDMMSTVKAGAYSQIYQR